MRTTNSADGRPRRTVVDRIFPVAGTGSVVVESKAFVDGDPVIVGGRNNGDALADVLGHVTQAAVIERIHIGDATLVARHNAATCTVDQVADQIAHVVGVVFGDGGQGGPTIDQHRRVVAGGDGDGQRIGCGFHPAAAHIAGIVYRQRQGISAAVVPARCIDQCGYRRVDGIAGSGDGHRAAGVRTRIHRDAGGARQGNGAVQHTERGLQVVVGGIAVNPIHDVHITEADACDANSEVFRHGLG